MIAYLHSLNRWHVDRLTCIPFNTTINNNIGAWVVLYIWILTLSSVLGNNKYNKAFVDQKTGAFVYYHYHHAHHHLCELLLLCHCSFDFSCWSISWWHCLIIDCISPAPDNMVHRPNHHLTHLTLVQSTLTTKRSQKYPQHGSPSQAPPTPINPRAISPYNQLIPKLS